ncbi:extracellular solute-binding protein [Paenibacillus qinlingensis]|uniref:Aldouronate transport system substrate-binding protein n=1 Tax=Paenibacillus qinlingensis TaxID=1837343 RepID=A0ABU1NUX6_9BACL|nr:extracellular solute-binding protein [Paenibacillus qinlingensis]MDR6550802.1 putative aldouronate transport system substrate-binding protein [Paenibacillus qinlingensis]
MKSSKKGVLTSLLSVTTISLLVAGCGNSTDTAKNSDDAVKKASEPVSLKIMANYDSPTLTEADQKFIKTLEEKNNVKIQFDIPPMSGYAEKLQLMLASGTYPDIVFFPDTRDVAFQNAVRDGLLLPVNDYINKLPELKQYTYQSEWDSLKVKNDDKIYGIPRTSILRNDGYWVRKDWLQNVGITLPGDGLVTKEQFADILGKFTFNDPDKNGKNDTYGYAGAVNPQSKVFDPILTGAFGVLGWQEANSGTYTYMDAKYDTSKTSYKDALAFTAKLYKEGVFDPDSATNDETKRRERFWRGMTGVYPGFAAHYTYHLPEIQKQTPSADLTYIWVKGEDGKASFNTGSVNSTGIWGFWGITKTAKNPEKAAVLLNSWLTDSMWETVKNGYEGNDYTIKDGQKVAPATLPTDYVRKNSMRRANDSSFFIKVGTPKDVVDKITPWLKTSIDTVVTSKDLGFQPEAARKPIYQDYQKTWDQTIMKIIMGKETVDKFTELQTGWYKNGGDEYAKQMNDYITSLKK